MSLLGGALAGALSGGANAAYDMADKTIDNNRRTAQEELAFKRTTALEQMRTQSAMARDDINYGRQLERDVTQRGYAVEDRNFAAQHATKLAGMRSSGGSASDKLPPQAKAALDLMEHLRKKSEFGELSPDEQAQYQQASRQYELFTGLAQFGTMMNTGGTGDIANTPEAQPQAGNETNYNDYASRVRDTEDEKPTPRGGLLLTDEAARSPVVQDTLDKRDRSNQTMTSQIRNVGDRFFNREMQESEQVAFRRFGDRTPVGNPEWEEWLKTTYPSVYQRRVERGEIKP